MRNEKFDSLNAFYRADSRREQSPEVDYGVMWRERGTWPHYRVSWIQNTGELYEVALKPAQGNATDVGPVRVLGRFDTREDVERVLDGWPDVCGPAESIRWVRRVAAAARAEA